MKPLPLFAVHDGSSKRSALTCKYKCGDACFHEVPNTSKGEYFGDIVKTAMSRRGVIKGGAMAVLAVGAGSALAACSTDEPAATGSATSSASGADTPPVDGVDFVAVEPNTEDAVVIPEGHEQAVVIRWGDPVVEGAPAFDFDNQTAAAQAMTADARQPQVLRFDAGSTQAKAAPDAYPLAMPIYAAARADIADKELRGDYADFIRYAVGAGQVPGLGNGELPPGYAPIPADWTAQALAAATKIAAGPQPAARSARAAGLSGADATARRHACAAVSGERPTLS